MQLTTANLTHAEAASQEYRMDLAAPEMVRVAKEAYTYQYELQLRKEQNEGDLNKDLASLNETLSAIQADIARYQAQMDTALERETNRANALAPEILEHTYQQDVLTKLESLSESMPQIVRVGGDGDSVDYLAIAHELVGGADQQLFSDEDMQVITSGRGDLPLGGDGSDEARRDAGGGKRCLNSSQCGRCAAPG